MKVAHWIIGGGMILALAGCGANSAETQSQVKVETEDQKMFYALGLAVAQQLGPFKGQLSAEEMELVKLGLADAAQDREELVKLEDYLPRLNERVQQLIAATSQEEKEKGLAFLEQATAEEGAIRTASGLVYKELVAGTGAQPQVTDKVTVHYHGTLVDGKVFDSSVERGEPLSFSLSGVIPGWTEGLQMMKVGGKARLVIPAELAYGEQGRQGSIPPSATLIFEVELLGIE